MFLFAATPGSAQHVMKPIRITAEAPTIDQRVELNEATLAELQTLPGVGPKRAAAIDRLRQKRPFRRVRELLRVKGIGRATLRRLSPLIYVRGEKTRRRASRKVPK